MLDSLHAFNDKLEALFNSLGARKLFDSELGEIGEVFGSAKIGWEVTTDLIYKDRPIFLWVIYCTATIFIRPRVFVRSQPQLKELDIPHVERNGSLCIWSNATIFRVEEPDTYLPELLSDALNLINDGIAKNNESDFREEFLSYWRHHSNPNIKAVSICDSNNLYCRVVYAYYSASAGNIFAESKEELVDWLDTKRLLPSKERKRARDRKLCEIVETPLLHFSQPWVPASYPKNTKQLLELVSAEYRDDAQEICIAMARAVANQYTIHTPFLVSFKAERGICYAALTLFKQYRTGRHVRSLFEGFRTNIDARVLLNRSSLCPLHAVEVTRADYTWCIGRDQKEELQDLKLAGDIVIIGCGSVGSGVAKLLIQSGIRSLVLVDGESLQSENISRHTLGYSYVGLAKAGALAASLKKDFPFVDIVAKDVPWQRISDDPDFVEMLRRADVIVSCTADWISDQGLLALQEQLETCPIVFAFTEAHAMASHVIVNFSGSGAFNSLHKMQGSEIGRMLHRVIDWPSNTVVKLPACGGAFQPYGMIELTNLHVLCASEVIRLVLMKEEVSVEQGSQGKWLVWFGDVSTINRLGGSWSPSWIDEFGSPNRGQFVATLIRRDASWNVQK